MTKTMLTLTFMVGCLSVLIFLVQSQNAFLGLRTSICRLERFQREDIDKKPGFHILSYDPLMIYIKDFITKSEREHFMALAESKYERSESTLEDGTLGIGDYRTSHSAPLPSDDETVRSVMRRVTDMQGFMSMDDMEAFQVVRYKLGQKFDPHYDWYHSSAEQNNTARITTIFAILHADCTDCGTQFPHLTYDWSKEDRRLCEFVDCSVPELTVKAIAGNALFWRNLRVDGSGDERTLHAGLPVPSGTKIGLNVFSRTTVAVPRNED